MIHFTLNHEEIALLKSLIGKKLLYLRHDSFDKFGRELVYGRVEMFFEDQIIMLKYYYEPFNLFEYPDDHPKFSIKVINECEAVSALQNTEQINIRYDRIIKGICMAEDLSEMKGEGKSDTVHLLKAIIIEFEDEQIMFQGDYMMPLIEFYKGENVIENLLPPGDEFADDPDLKLTAKRLLVQL